MKKYEYKEVSESETKDLETKINEYGKEGWRCIGYTISDGGYSSALLERETEKLLTQRGR